MNIGVDVERVVYEVGEHSYNWKISPDPDGLGVKIAYVEGGKEHTAMSFSIDVARKIAESILKCSDELSEEQQ